MRTEPSGIMHSDTFSGLEHHVRVHVRCIVGVSCVECQFAHLRVALILLSHSRVYLGFRGEYELQVIVELAFGERSLTEHRFLEFDPVALGHVWSFTPEVFQIGSQTGLGTDTGIRLVRSASSLVADCVWTRMSTAGHLGDSRTLSERAREYANYVINGEEWPLTPDHVDLSRVTFETSTRMDRQHGVCSYDGNGQSTIRLSETTYERAGFEAMKETIRHELVHAYQQQTAGVESGHGDSFTRWVEPLALSGRCSTHYDKSPGDYKYQFYCTQGCGFIDGRHRWSKAVAQAIRGDLVCGDCDSNLRVGGPDGTLEEVPEWRTDTPLDEYDLRYEFHCPTCGLIGGRRQMCKTVRRVARGETICQNCGSLEIAVRDEAGNPVTPADL